jgi:hypothetical protein
MVSSCAFRRSDNAALLTKVAAMQQQQAEQQDAPAAAAPRSAPAADDAAARAAAAEAAAAASDAAAATLRAENAELTASAQRLSSQLKEAVAAAQAAASAAAATSTHSTANDKALNARIAELSAANAELQASAGSATDALYRAGGSGSTAGVLQHSAASVACHQLGQGLALAYGCMRRMGQLSNVCNVWRDADEQHCSTPATCHGLSRLQTFSQMQTRQPSSGTWTSSGSPATEASNPKSGEDGGGGGAVELELLRHELEDLRHDNAEMESGFHEAAAQVGFRVSRVPPVGGPVESREASWRTCGTTTRRWSPASTRPPPR